MRVRRLRAAGFTLVELLVVCIIISILAGLTSMAVLRALDRARTAAFYYEEKNMEQAMRNVMTDFGTTTWPPCDLRMTSATDLNEPIAKYFKRIFPRYNINNLYNDLQTAGVNTTTFDPGQALVFWLVGFNPDVTQPLSGHAARMSGTDVSQRLYPFVTTRLANNHYLMYGMDSMAIYDVATFNNTQTQKYRGYLYFDNNGSTYLATGSTTALYSFNGFSPYTSAADATDFYNTQDRCQIICAGQDQFLGVGGAPPAANVPYNGYDSDNVTNFGGGQNMKVVYENLKQL